MLHDLTDGIVESTAKNLDGDLDIVMSCRLVRLS
jgi:hypothetical protein